MLVRIEERVDVIFVVSRGLSSEWLIELSWDVINLVLLSLSQTSWSSWIDLSQVGERGVSLSQFVRVIDVSEVIIRSVVFSDDSLFGLMRKVVIGIFYSFNNTI